MFRDMKLPEGKVTKVFVGGTDALKKILPLLSRKKFTGYLRIVEKNNRAHGYVVMRQGRRVLTAVLDSNGVSTGKEALPRFRKLTRSPGAMIEVHVDLDVDSAIKALKELHGKGPAGLGAFKRRLEEWRKEGRDAGSPEAITDRDLSEAIKAFADQTEKATSAADLEEIVERALAEGLRAEGKEPRKRTREGSLQEPKKETEARRRKTTRGKEAERARLKAPRAEESSSVSGEPRRVRSTGDVTRDIGLLEKYTFENYVVGDSNRFAYAACLAVAEGSVDPYNPLFVVGKPGLGKTHLLQALGNRMLERAPKTKLRYLSARRFMMELEEAERQDRIFELRKSFRQLDVFILDDLQDIQGKRRVQEELFDLFEDLHAKGRPLVLAADRHPSEMRDVAPRLVSRFESGLVTDLQPPDLKTRLAYLKVLLSSRDASCPARVLKHIAERFTLDMRELEGALNRVLAYALALKKPVDLTLAREALGEESSGTPVSAPPRASLDPLPGHSYLIEEEKPEVAYSVFAQRVRNLRGLLITRINPSRVRDRFGIKTAEILWLTDRTDSSERTVEPVLERLMHRVETLMVTGGQGVVMLDGLDYLKSNNSFEGVLRFIRRLIDDISESEFTFILPINPATLEERELKILEGEMDVYRP